MRYRSFTIENYRAIKQKLVVDLEKRIVPLVGINECGKTTILQAIFCFDKGNDAEYNGKHLENMQNLYETEHKDPPIISASIETTPSELESIVSGIIQTYRSSKNSSSDNVLSEYEAMLSEKTKNKFINLQMIRDLSNKQYAFTNYFDQLPIDLQNKIGNEIIGYLPYILYNDDFNDRPLDSIPISTDEKKTKSGWEAIFDRVFKSTAQSYSLLSCLKQSDSKTQRSILSDVEKYLNDALTKEWRKFSPKREKIAIQLGINVEKSTLDVFIEDDLNGKSRFFNISDRSKGFIWYYNFIMKVRFNPKHTANIKDTIFLLDEPGSYLHEAAQASLCKKLKDISEAQGVVIYCTHSPRLLLPQNIPLNNIMIVDKSSKGYISAINISNYKTTGKKNTAMQPVFEALMIPEYEMIHTNEKIICVEGIYDKYAIELFMSVPSDCRIFASVNAESIINNIQYFISYRKPYVALWDNDEEGKKCYGKAQKIYGTIESDNFLLLPSKKSGKRRMEEMFEGVDLEKISKELGLQSSANYESIISTLYFGDDKIKHKIKEMISLETQNNFTNLAKSINTHFEK